MHVETSDFNDADALMNSTCQAQWKQLQKVLKDLPLHLHGSDQAGIQGNLIFDPKGTNQFVKSQLGKKRGWTPNPPIPNEYAFLGTDVDFVAGGLLVEIQFSNYPFLLNNAIRSDLFFKTKARLAKEHIQGAVIVTKAKMFPASNSTLYFEQAKEQLSELSRHGIVQVPIRLVGLFEQEDAVVPTVFTVYEARYARKDKIMSQTNKLCQISPGKTARSRCELKFTSSKRPKK